MTDDLVEILQESLQNGTVECRDCGNLIEPDCDKCSCGWENPIVYSGMI